MVYAGGLFAGRAVLYEEIGWTAYARDGLLYAIPFLFFLTVHEFGHYIAAQKHGINVSLPYYIPIPLIGIPMFHLGTLGAVIRIREPLRRTRQLFDIGAAGPLAGLRPRHSDRRRWDRRSIRRARSDRTDFVNVRTARANLT